MYCGSRHEWRWQRQQIGRIDCQSSKAGAPVQVRSRHAAGRSNKPDLLTAFDSVSSGNHRLTHMEVASHETVSVIDVHDVPGEKEFRDERDDSAVCGEDRIAKRPAVVDAKVTARHAPVENAAVAELTRDPRGPRPKEGKRPELRRLLRVATNISRERVLTFDARFRDGIHGARELGIDAQAARAWRASMRLRQWLRLMRKTKDGAERVNDTRASLDTYMGDNGVRCIDGNRAERLEPPFRRRAKMKSLTSHDAGGAYGRVRVPDESVDRHSNKSAHRGLARFEHETSLRQRSARENKHRNEQVGTSTERHAGFHKGKLHGMLIVTATRTPSTGITNA